MKKNTNASQKRKGVRKKHANSFGAEYRHNRYQHPTDAIKNYRVKVLAVTRRLIKPFVLTTSKINAELTAVVPVGRVTAGAV